MKKIILCSIMLALAHTSFSQHKNSKQVLTRQDYLKKSKNQKTTAWILAGVGTAFITTGILIGNQDYASFNDAYGAIVTGVIGAGFSIASMTLFIASGKNKERAMRATAYLKTENAYTARGFNRVRTLFGVCSLKIGL